MTTEPAPDPPYYASPDGEVTLHHGDSLDILPTLPDNSIDAIVCDPPYGLANLHPRVVTGALTAWLAGDRAYVPADGQGGFMGRAWDRFVPPPAAWDQCLRVLKPGGHLVAFAAPRTADLMGLSIRLAGFEIRDSLHWIYGSGFPKGQDIAKAIDKRRDGRQQVLQVTAWLKAARDAAGRSNRDLNRILGWPDDGHAQHFTTQGVAAAVPNPEQWDQLREALGFDDTAIRTLVAELNRRKGEVGEAWSQREVIGHRTTGLGTGRGTVPVIQASENRDLTAPASEAAKRWQGWNTALKPAHEPIILARKSTGYDTTVANVLRHGAGALNIDGCRTNNPGPHAQRGRRTFAGFSEDRQVYGDGLNSQKSPENPAGRWPTNVVLTHAAILGPDGEIIGDACADGCVPGCPAAELDQQSGITKSSGGSGSASGRPGQAVYGTYGQHRGANAGGLGDTGGASRFFPAFRYEAKAPASERPRLADGTAHPTVKPAALMSWLVRLVTPPGGLVLDPFAGTGTTLQAALAEGMHAIGIEQHQPYCDLTVARLTQPIALGLFGDTA